MRLLLDHNLSPRGVGDPLRAAGHDVLSLAGVASLEGLDDPDVLALAAAEERILVTRNSRDFAPITREWAELRRSHAGVILIWTLDHARFSEIVSGVAWYLARYPDRESWRDLVVAI